MRPGISLSSDFIVGFPGETATDFDQLMRLVEDVGFDSSFSFVFSARPGHPPRRCPTTRRKPKLARLQRLQAQLEIAGARNSRSRGSAPGSASWWKAAAARTPSELMGRTECNRIVNFKGPARLVGQMIDVTITQALPHSLRGEPVLSETLAA